jgi:hypothetical protein
VYDATIPTESERVEAWRLHVLVEHGYTVAIAEQLAVASHVDLHQAVELVAAGCPPALSTRTMI